MFNRPEPETVLTPHDAAAQAGAFNAIVEPADELRNHCRQIINAAALPEPYRGRTLAKMEEMVFWMRTGMTSRTHK